jgi:hypothetical protein
MSVTVPPASKDTAEKAEDDKKWKLYQQDLHSMIGARTVREQKPIKVHVTNADPTAGKTEQVGRQEAGEGEQEQEDASFMSLFSKAQRDKARQLLRFFEKSDDLSWSDLGEIRSNGQLIKGGYIVELINYLIGNKNVKSKPQGWSVIAESIAKLNIPSYLITNDNARTALSTIRIVGQSPLLTAPRTPKKVRSELSRKVEASSSTPSPAKKISERWDDDDADKQVGSGWCRVKMQSKKKGKCQSNAKVGKKRVKACKEKVKKIRWRKYK